MNGGGTKKNHLPNFQRFPRCHFALIWIVAIEKLDERVSIKRFREERTEKKPEENAKKESEPQILKKNISEKFLWLFTTLKFRILYFSAEFCRKDTNLEEYVDKHVRSQSCNNFCGGDSSHAVLLRQIDRNLCLSQTHYNRTYRLRAAATLACHSPINWSLTSEPTR